MTLPPRDPAGGDSPVDQSWAEYRRLVLGELERLGRRIEETAMRNDLAVQALNQRIELLQSGQIAEMRIAMADLRARSGMMGGLMGALTGVAVAIGSLLLHKA